MLARLSKALGRTLLAFAEDILSSVVIPSVQSSIKLPFQTPPPKKGLNRVGLFRLASTKYVDGAVMAGTVPGSWAKFALKNGLPLEENGKTLAVENQPHTIDDFSGTIQSGYGKGVKTLVYSGLGVLKIDGRSRISKINLHLHEAERAGRHFDLVIEGVQPGCEKFEFYIPSGPYEGRYAVVRTLFGEKKRVLPVGLLPDLNLLSFNSKKVSIQDKKLILAELPNRMVIRMKDRGIVLPKPKYKLVEESWLESLGEDWHQDWVVERKYDGSLANCNIEGNRAYFRSHRDGGKTYVDLVPDVEFIKNNSRLATVRLLVRPPRLEGTVLQGELVHQKGSSKMAGILNSLPDKAQEYQKLHGGAEFYVWNVIAYRGRDVSGLPYAERRDLLEQIVADIRPFNRHWHAVEACPKFVKPKVFYDYVVSSPLPFGEGVIVKGRGGQPDAWIKVKRFDLVDLEVAGFVEGSGKYKGSLGAVLVKNPETGAVGEVGSFNLTDTQRQWIWNRREALTGQVARVKTMEMTGNGIPRAGVFVGWHPDKADVANLMYLEPC